MDLPARVYSGDTSGFLQLLGASPEFKVEEVYRLEGPMNDRNEYRIRKK